MSCPPPGAVDPEAQEGTEAMSLENCRGILSSRGSVSRGGTGGKGEVGGAGGDTLLGPLIAPSHARGRYSCYLILPPGAQRGEATHPRSHSLKVAELGLERRCSAFVTVTPQEGEGGREEEGI